MANFNSFIDKIDLDSLRELCLMQGKLRHYNINSTMEHLPTLSVSLWLMKWQQGFTVGKDESLLSNAMGWKQNLRNKKCP